MISIIVPVYKVEKYLKKCVRSILEQTYRDFELLLIDDGSPDSCPQICDMLADTDNRIQVFHKQNGGLSDARNYGMKYAKGEYITFVDSDDFIHRDYLKSLYNIRLKYAATMSAVGSQKVYEGESIKAHKVMKGKESCIEGSTALCKMLYQDTLDTHAWGVLLPTELARKYPFPVGKYHEDEFITYNYYYEAESVAILDTPLYYYLQRNNSIMRLQGQAVYDELDAADALVDFCLRKARYAISAAKSKQFSDYCQVLLSADLDNYDYQKIEKTLLCLRNDILRDSTARKKNRIAAVSLIAGIRGLLLLNTIARILRIR